MKGDREGIEWAAARAIKHGATWQEVYEAAFLAGLRRTPPPEAPLRVARAMRREFKRWDELCGQSA